jgi:hypothetical protein
MEDSTLFKVMLSGICTNLTKGSIISQEGVILFDGLKFARNMICMFCFAIVHICAEWENSGFPFWFMKQPIVHSEVNDAVYLTHVRDF